MTTQHTSARLTLTISDGHLLTDAERRIVELFAHCAMVRAEPASLALDSAGVPWDARVHAATRGRNFDGRWKKLKNVDDATRAAVEAELRAALPAAAKGPSALDDEPPDTFAGLTAWAAKLVAAGELTQGEVGAIVTPIGAASIVGLANRPDLVPNVHTALVAAVRSRQHLNA